MVEASRKIAVLFPGQGSQYVGMGKVLAEQSPIAASIFKDADEILGFPFSEIIFKGPEDELTLTKNSQPAIYVTSWAAFSVLKDEMPGLKPSYYAGLSLGEYTAYAAAGSFTFETGLKLVRKRGELMQKSGEEHIGTMASVMGLDVEAVEAICSDAAKRNPVNVANINSPGQIVISGSVEGVDEASRKCAEAGAKRVIPLKVSGAFHSSLMQDAGTGLAEYLESVDISEPAVPVLSNVTARETTGAEEIRKTLARQVTDSVRWKQSMEYLNDVCSVNTFIECGCGKVLRGLLKRTVPDAVAFGVEDPESLKTTIAGLDGPG